MSASPQQPAATSHAEAIAKGAGVNILGTVGKALFPIFFVIVTRLYSAEIVGVYVLASVILETAVSFTVSGFSDAVVMYSSRYADDPAHRAKLYDTLANGFIATLVICVITVILAHVGGPELLHAYYDRPGIVEAVQTLSWSLPFLVFSLLVVGATRALLIMKWDALLMAFLRPLLLVIFTLAFWLGGAGLSGVLWAWNAAHIVVAVLAGWVFARCYSWSALFSALRRPRFSSEVHVFAIPQNLNMTFNNLVTNMDVIMLAYFGYSPEVIGFFGVGSRILSNIRQIKLAFSSSYAPVVARYHSSGDAAALNDSYSMVTRWITSLALPVVLVCALLRGDLLRLVHASFHGSSAFMLWLLVPPLLSCALGLAGNIIVAAGHSGYNLLNSFLIAGTNALFNYLLIPRFGMIGAAAATASAMVLIAILQLVEARYLVGARLRAKLLYKPWVAIAPATLIALFGHWALLDTTLLGRIALAVIGVVLYVVLLGILGLDPRDRPVLLPFLRQSAPAPAAASDAPIASPATSEET